MEAMHAAQAGSSAIDSLGMARRALRWMAQGVMPAQSVATQAMSALGEAEVSSAGVAHARRALSAIGMGIAPSQEVCLLADREIEAAIEEMRRQENGRLRPSSRG